MSVALTVLQGLAVLLVFCGAVPLVVAAVQFLLVGFERYRGLYRKSALTLPRTAILIPAWNEADVLTPSVERLLTMRYPAERLRVFVVDDASTDRTPEVMAALRAEHGPRVVHLRREQGGQGKAHTLNHGLRRLLADDWAQAVLIMDADVVFDRDALWRMARHLHRTEVGAVTAYIKEGTGDNGNYLNRYIAVEYVTAQAAARRAQNVLGAMACLAGGAQLHSRANLETIGGQIDTTTLAEDTVTTFETQLAGRRVVFDGEATVLAEEPGDLAGLWRQRLRWARGNLQVTRRYRDIWFRGRFARGHGHRLGSWFFGTMWFSLLLTPLLLVLSSASLILLYFTDAARAWEVFRWLWVINLVSYFLVVLVGAAVDGPTTRRCWLETLFFPGAVSCFFLVCTGFPGLISTLSGNLGLIGPGRPTGAVMLVAYTWLALSMPLAWLAKCLVGTRLRRLAPVLVFFTGYGALLAACTVAACVAELRNADMTWQKTVKTGKVDVR
jgi:cellulose synthase/poly-beta-1,6-N-acetylglucosamine synthase-like glycosyltransferase